MTTTFSEAVRKIIFYRRVQLAGSLLFATVTWFQLLDLRKYLPGFAYSTLHIVLFLGAMVLGLGAQMYAVRKLIKIKADPRIKTWQDSLLELRRIIYILSATLAVAMVWVMTIIIIGMDEHNLVDYRFLLTLAIMTTMWVVFFGELVIPHSLPTSHSVTPDQTTL